MFDYQLYSDKFHYLHELRAQSEPDGAREKWSSLPSAAAFLALSKLVRNEHLLHFLYLSLFTNGQQRKCKLLKLKFASARWKTAPRPHTNCRL